MENKSYEYTTNDFSAVDQHVKELAKETDPYLEIVDR